MLRHSRTGRAFVFVRDEAGERRQIPLGPWGSPEADRRYHEELAKWHARQLAGETAAAVISAPATRSITIADAAASYLLRCDRYYRRPDGTPTGEAENCTFALGPLLELFGDEQLANLTPQRVNVVRERMIAGDPRVPAEKRRGWCRTVVNHSVNRIRTFVKWCVAEGLVSPVVHSALCALAPLKRGRSEAREPKPTKPVSDADVEKTLPYLPPVVRDMVQVQHLVGMRGGELCALTTGELDMSESVASGCWVFRPRQSKLSYRGRQVEYVLGPRAVELMRPYVKADPNAPLFSPAESEARRRAEQRARRQTKVQPSHADRSVPNPGKKPGDRYDSRSYAHAIRHACVKAGVEPWSPHALRRAVATRVRAQFGIEAARVALAHATVEMATLYGHRDLRVAAEIASKIG